MATEQKLPAGILTSICIILLLLARTPVDKPEATEHIAVTPSSAAVTPTTLKGTAKREEVEVSPLPSDLIFVIGEMSGAYWVDLLTTEDELPCGNFRLVSEVVSEGIEGMILTTVEGITLDGDVCVESVGPAGAHIQLGRLAGETELRFQYEEQTDIYALKTSPGFLTIDTLTARFTNAEYEDWQELQFLYFYNALNERWETLPENILLFYTTTAWNEGDGAALRLASGRVFDEVLALGARPLSADEADYGVFYPTPPLEGNPTQIIHYFRYDGPFTAIEELLSAQDEIRMNVYSGAGSYVPTPKPIP